MPRTRPIPSLAPPGHSAYYVLSPVPHLGTADIDWAIEGPRYRDRIFDYLEQRYIPNLRRDLVVSRMLTPFDFRDELNSHLGSAFSLEPILTQSAWFRPHNRDRDIAGLYFVGAGTHPGAGVPGVVGSAKATAKLILDDAAAWRVPRERRHLRPAGRAADVVTRPAGTASRPDRRASPRRPGCSIPSPGTAPACSMPGAGIATT